MKGANWRFVMFCAVALAWLHLGACDLHAQQALFFSTEEDFVSRGPVPADGNPIISDGDLLVIPKYPDMSVTQVYAHNRELLAKYEVRADLGLDAVDVLEREKRLIAFSTELDDPAGRFTAGDLLLTDGTILPHAALVARFDLPKRLDLGLDALQLVGDADSIARLIGVIRERGPDSWKENPGALPELLEELKVDILFSTEGTAPVPEKPRFLDGDLLSARTGTIVVSNADFLPSLPAGVPSRGVDFGCDAFTNAVDPIEQVKFDLFSTEISSLVRRLPFTDGDILARGNGVVLKNGTLIKPLEPVVAEVGLDALDYEGKDVPQTAMRITSIWWVKTADLDADGFAPNDLTGDSTDLTVNDRPFGSWLKIHGNLPNASPGFDPNDYEYRIEFLEAAATWKGIRSPNHYHPGDVNWYWEVEAAVPAGTSFAYVSDADGWFELSDFLRTDDRKTLVVWDSKERGNGKSALRISLKEKVSGTLTYSPTVPIALDNDVPRDNASYPDIVLTGAFTSQCDIPADARTITITGEIRDENFYRFGLVWYQSGLPANPIVTRYHDEGLAYLDGTGTLPVGAYPTLGTVTIPAGVGCGFIRLIAYDRTIVGEFHTRPPGVIDELTTEPDAWQARDYESFCFKTETKSAPPSEEASNGTPGCDGCGTESPVAARE